MRFVICKFTVPPFVWDGFTLAALYSYALERSRQLDPEISLGGLDGIRLRDELELGMPL